MGKLKDLTGMKFGRLEVKERGTSRVTGKQVKTYWLCKCDCGTILEVAATALQSGQQSCGKCIVRRIDMIGQKFGRLAVVSLDTEKTNEDTDRSYWFCKCECGEVVSVRRWSLISGVANSCGCLQREVCGNINKKHGMCQSNEYKIWAGIKARCYDEKTKGYLNYGGRGIIMCDRWLIFDNFYADMGDRPNKKMSIERIDNEGNYCKENCRWATRIEQQNNKRNNIYVTYEGKTLSLSAWSREKNINTGTLNGRYHRGKRGEELFTHNNIHKLRAVELCP